MAKGKAKVGGLTVARHVVQVVMACLFCVPLFAAGWTVLGRYAGGDDAVATPSELPVWGSLSSSQILGIDLLDPFAALQVIVASKSVASAMLWVLPVLILYVLIRGRVFCGWVCPVNLFLEVVDWIRGRLGIKVSEMPVPRWVKPVVAAAVLVLSAIVSVPIFEMVSPVGALNRTILFGSTLGLWTLVAIVIVELFWGHRVWCRSLCPLGGFYQTIGAVGLLSVKIDHDACISCNLCKKACLCDPSILDAAVAGEADRVASGDCMLCGKCVDHCPKDALKIGVAVPKDLSL
ncbi:4Fe-4S binding protein [Slackia heliotrinireducens]|uniref:4Fe-4S binding protein n=1 Tax=Slackia heliotrinireducens TaxID=84110 RepID=UPI003314C5C7